MKGISGTSAGRSGGDGLMVGREPRLCCRTETSVFICVHLCFKFIPYTADRLCEFPGEGFGEEGLLEFGEGVQLSLVYRLQNRRVSK